MKRHFFLFLFYCLGLSVCAQPGLKSFSPVLDQELEQVNSDFESAVLLSGRDTLCSLHYTYGQLSAQQGPFVIDSLWTQQDTTFWSRNDPSRKRLLIRAYLGKLSVYEKLYKEGKLQQYNRRSYRNDLSLSSKLEWKPSSSKLVEHFPDGSTMTTFKESRNHTQVWTFRKSDTTISWVTKGSDTMSIQKYWKNYHQDVKFLDGAIYTNIRQRDTSIFMFEKGIKDDSVFSVKTQALSFSRSYSKQAGSSYRLERYEESKGFEPVEHDYRFDRGSDTAQHFWRLYEPIPGNKSACVPTRRSADLYLDADSNLYKRLDYHYDLNGTLDHYTLKRPWRFKKRIEAPKPTEPTYRPTTRKEKRSIEEDMIILTDLVKDEEVNVKLGKYDLEHLVRAHLKPGDLMMETMPVYSWWHETLILEIDADGRLVGWRKSPHSGLDIKTLAKKTQGAMVTTSTPIKTQLIVKDRRGRTKKLETDHQWIAVQVKMMKRSR